MVYVVYDKVTRDILQLKKRPPKGLCENNEYLEMPDTGVSRLGLLQENKSEFRVGWHPTKVGEIKIYRKRKQNALLRWSNQSDLIRDAQAAGCLFLENTIGNQKEKARFKKDFFCKTLGCIPEPLDYLEFGVHKGNSLRLLASLLTHKKSRLLGFDTFCGYPEPWLVSKQVHRDQPDFSLTKKDQSELYSLLKDSRVQLLKGRFQDTLPDFIRNQRNWKKRRKLIYINSDLYSSALFTLCSLYPHLSTSDIIVMMLGGKSRKENEFKAFNDFIHAFYLKEKVKFLVSGSNAWHIAFRL